MATWIVNRTVTRGFRRDELFEVTEADQVVGTLNNTRATFELRNQPYSVAASGIISREYQLKSGDNVVATSHQKVLVNHHTVTFAGREWIYKATNLLATEFGLFDNEIRTGTFTPGSFFSRLKGIRVDLPDHVPGEIRMFLLLLYVAKLTEPTD